MSDTVLVAEQPTSVIVQSANDIVSMIDQPTYVTVASSGQTITVPDKTIDVVTVQATTNTVVVPSQTVEIVEVGIQGPPGVDGTGDKYYTQAFNVSSSVSVTHNLGKYPAVSVLDSAYDEVEGDVIHLDTNNLTVHFTAPFSGTITCN